MILCSGQVYYDLFEKRQAEGATDVALVRLEQIGPFRYDAFDSVISAYPREAEVVMTCEEHMNFSSFGFVEPRANIVLKKHKFAPIKYVGRPISTTTATGSHSTHQKEFAKVLADSLA